MLNAEAQPYAFDGRRILPKPPWLTDIETRLGRCIHLHPNAISSLKLLLIIPLVLTIPAVSLLPSSPFVFFPLLAAFFVMDYLDGVVAREHRQETTFGRIYDRVTDFPLLMIVGLYCAERLPVTPLLLKLGLDAVLLALFIAGKGPVENRVRTTISYSTVGVLLLLGQGWAPRFVTTELATSLLWLSITFSCCIIAIRIHLVPRRWVVWALPAANPNA